MQAPRLGNSLVFLSPICINPAANRGKILLKGRFPFLQELQGFGLAWSGCSNAASATKGASSAAAAWRKAAA
jgi:hypothetical protein